MHRLTAVFGVALTGTGFFAAAPTAPSPPDIRELPMMLTAGEASPPLGEGTALVMGGSGTPTPPPSYLDAVNSLYLPPFGFSGTPQALTTPEDFFPTTGVNSMTAFASETQGAQTLAATIQSQIADGHVDAANPVVVVGYSQSSALSSLAMTQLAEQGVPTGDVHFVLLGDTAAPNGGLLERFDVPIGSNPTIPSLGITFGYPTPDLYPTDVYTIEYDGFADYPRYPIDLPADLNALAGLFLEHSTYPGLQPGQIAGAIPLATTAGDTLTHYYMIPQDHLPLLDLVRLLPVVGNPLADLVEPDLKVLVNLGYGSITNGWDDGPANVQTAFGLLPTNLNWGEVLTALVNGIPQGLNAAINDLGNPDTYDIAASLAHNPMVEPLLNSAHAVGLLPDGPDTYLGALNDQTLADSLLALLNSMLSTPSHPSVEVAPLMDVVQALTATLPAFDASVALNQLESGDLLGVIGDPYALNMALIPFAIGLALNSIHL